MLSNAEPNNNSMQSQRSTPENSQALAFAIFSELQLYHRNC